MAVGEEHLNVRNQDLLSTEYIEIDPVNKVDLDGDKPPSQIDIEYLATKPVLFGHMTKFFISGRFDVKKDAAADWAAVGLQTLLTLFCNIIGSKCSSSLWTCFTTISTSPAPMSRDSSPPIFTQCSMLTWIWHPRNFFAHKRLIQHFAFQRKKTSGPWHPNLGKITPLSSLWESPSPLIFSPCFNLPSISAATL